MVGVNCFCYCFPTFSFIKAFPSSFPTTEQLGQALSISKWTSTVHFLHSLNPQEEAGICPYENSLEAQLQGIADTDGGDLGVKWNSNVL